MRVVIAGGHGQIARHLERILVARGDEPVGMVRSSEHVGDLEADGAAAVLLDLEATSLEEMTEAVRGADAVVFAAGGGGDGNAERKRTVDRDGAILLADAAQAAGVRRYVMISSMGQDRADPESEEVFDIYLLAKKAADEDLRARDLDWTIVKPGALTDDDPTGLVQLDSSESGEIPRADVAAVVAAALEDPASVGKAFNALGGKTPVVDAVALL
ncbi:MAG: SDR family oxidoreductase [Marmoricola sp.]